MNSSSDFPGLSLAIPKTEVKQKNPRVLYFVSLTLLKMIQCSFQYPFASKKRYKRPITVQSAKDLRALFLRMIPSVRNQ
jgi:hypothetical protein